MKIEMNMTKNTNTTFYPESEIPCEGFFDHDYLRIDPHYTRIQTLLNHVNPDLDYDEWKNTIRLIYLETDGSEEGFGFVLDWSKKSVSGYDHDFIVAMWGYEGDTH